LHGARRADRIDEPTRLFGPTVPFDNLADFIPLLEATSAEAIKRQTAALHGQD
jgi:hypothetical protein